MRLCQSCKWAAESPGYAWYCTGCLWCGARLIGSIDAIRGLTVERVRERKRKVLADWMAMGHSETAIRELAKGPPCFQPLELVTMTPKTGQAVNTASARPSPKKRR